MNLVAALLLQAGGLGKNAQAHPPGSEGPFSRVTILIFLILLAIGVVLAVTMVLRGAAGATKAKSKEKEL